MEPQPEADRSAVDVDVGLDAGAASDPVTGPQRHRLVSPALLRAARELWMDAPARPEDLLAFDGYVEEVSFLWARRFLLAVVAIVLLWWPIDYLAYGGGSRIFDLFSVWRGSFLTLCVAMLWFLGWSRSKRIPLPIVTMVFLVPAMVLSYAVFARLGGPEIPWVHSAYVVPPLTIILLLPPGWRLAVNVVVACTIWCTLELLVPGFGEYAYRTGFAMLLAVSVLFAVGSGHAFLVLLRRNFLQARAMERLATTDPLTGVRNRRSFFEAAAAEVDRARRHGHALGVLMLDIDHFKRINDERGHAVGDRALIAVARTLVRELRAHDSIGRLGGEEFGILLPHSSLATTRDAGERMRAAVAATKLEELRGATVTVSVGCAELRDGESQIDPALGRADRRLYDAKRTGRDRVVSDEA